MVWFRGLTPQQQPGSYQGGEMMMTWCMYRVNMLSRVPINILILTGIKGVSINYRAAASPVIVKKVPFLRAGALFLMPNHHQQQGALLNLWLPPYSLLTSGGLIYEVHQRSVVHRKQTLWTAPRTTSIGLINSYLMMVIYTRLADSCLIFVPYQLVWEMG